MKLTLTYPPSINNYYFRSKTGGVYISKKGQDFRKSTIAIVRESGLDIMLNKSIVMVIMIYMPDKRKRDADNVCKAVLDALTHSCLYFDDALIHDLRIIKMEVDRKNPRVEILIEEIDETEFEKFKNRLKKKK